MGPEPYSLFSLRLLLCLLKDVSVRVSLSITVVYHEYIKHTLRKALEQSTVKVINWFRQIDVDKNGVITRDEWRRAISEVGFQAPVESVDELFDDIDRCACCLGLGLLALCDSALKDVCVRVSFIGTRRVR